LGKRPRRSSRATCSKYWFGDAETIYAAADGLDGGVKGALAQVLDFRELHGHLEAIAGGGEIVSTELRSA